MVARCSISLLSFLLLTCLVLECVFAQESCSEIGQPCDQTTPCCAGLRCLFYAHKCVTGDRIRTQAAALDTDNSVVALQA